MLDIGVLQPEDCDLNEVYGTITTGRAPEEPIDFPLAEAEVKGTSPSCRMVRDDVYGFPNWR